MTHKGLQPSQDRLSVPFVISCRFKKKPFNACVLISSSRKLPLIILSLNCDVGIKRKFSHCFTKMFSSAITKALSLNRLGFYFQLICGKKRRHDENSYASFIFHAVFPAKWEKLASVNAWILLIYVNSRRWRIEINFSPPTTAAGWLCGKHVNSFSFVRTTQEHRSTSLSHLYKNEIVGNKSSVISQVKRNRYDNSGQRRKIVQGVGGSPRRVKWSRTRKLKNH